MKLIPLVILALSSTAAAAAPWGMPYTIECQFEAITSTFTTYKGPVTLYWTDEYEGYAFDVGYGLVTISESEVDHLTYTTNGAVADWTEGIEGRPLKCDDYIILPLRCDYGFGTKPYPSAGIVLLGMGTGILVSLLATLWHAPLRGFRGVAE